MAAESAPAPRLLPFQGRLTDQEGKAVENGAYLILFQMFDAPVNGTVKWMGELHRTSVNGGLVNVQLGSGTPLGALDFDQPLFLQVTVDINKDGMINQEDPPMLPRQAILPAVFAKESAVSRDSEKLAGRDWSSILVEGNDPEAGQIRGNKIQEKSIQGSQLAPGSIGAAQLGAESVGLTHLRNDAVAVEKLTPVLRQLIEEVLAPPGSITAFGGGIDKIPAGWELCDGRPLKSMDPQYARLYKVISTNWGAGIPGTEKDFNLPDLRGIFLRGVNGNRQGGFADSDVTKRTVLNGDASRTNNVGSLQDDAFQGHAHTLYYKSVAAPAGGDPVNQTIYRHDARIPEGTVGQEMIQSPITRDGYGEVRVTSETRPQNAYVYYIIKL